MRYWSSPPWTDPADGVEMVERMRRSFVEGSLYQWAATNLSDARPADEVQGDVTVEL